MKRALFVGLNDYPSAPLNGCVRDATIMRDLLRDNEDGSHNFDCQLFTDAKDVTRQTLKASINRLFDQPADMALLYFSGHGYLNDKLGGYLVTSDAARYDEGVSMQEVLALANRSPVTEAIIILDCCHSGSFGSSNAHSGDEVFLAKGRSVLTASQADEASVEQRGQGVFTSLVCDALVGGAADVLGKVTVASIYAYVDEVFTAWEQRPLLKANVSKLHPLRLCKPQPPLETLRKISEYFSVADYDFPLDPSFEPTAEPNHPDNECIFANLQKFRAARLVEPVGEEHMYYAAINSKSCRLTKLGQFYWRLSKDGRL